mgnify:CR=1 FL=1
MHITSPIYIIIYNTNHYFFFSTISCLRNCSQWNVFFYNPDYVYSERLTPLVRAIQFVGLSYGIYSGVWNDVVSIQNILCTWFLSWSIFFFWMYSERMKYYIFPLYFRRKISICEYSELSIKLFRDCVSLRILLEDVYSINNAL